MSATSAAESTTDEVIAYEHALAMRAQKIIAPLALTDATKVTRAREIIIQHYRDLNDIQAARDAAIVAARSFSGESAYNAAVASAREVAETKVAKLHPEFLAQLAAELTPGQIDQVKDGLTYGVLPLTYRVYLEMLPQLTEEQKTQIREWLVEAREHAIDGFTSSEKHAWFGKYKGRINNYLAKAGYDMKQAEKALRARQHAMSPSH